MTQRASFRDLSQELSTLRSAHRSTECSLAELLHGPSTLSTKGSEPKGQSLNLTRVQNARETGN
jgi:hypothetical protein